MAFMVPEYTKLDSVMFRGTNSCGASEVFEDAASALEYALATTPRGWNMPAGVLVECERGVFCRLSAPGYMDCTDWMGPYNTHSEARAAIAGFYEVDPETGDELPED
jgi:hypothetical protein